MPVAYEARSAGAASPWPSASTTASAASMPLFIAVWLPLIFTLLRVPASQPINRPPGKYILGNEFSPPLVIALAP